MRRTANEAAQTREDIIHVGRALFAAEGFAGTSLDQIAAKAKVTRGAVHHHFGDKTGLFREVLAQLVKELNDAIAAATAQTVEPWSGFAAAVTACLLRTSQTDYLQIVVHDAPAVLGRADYERTDPGILSTVATGLKLLNDRNILALTPEQRTPVTVMLHGALLEGAKALGRGDASLETLRDSFLHLVLRYQPGQQPTIVDLTQVPLALAAS